MKSEANSPDQYTDALPPERRQVIEKLRGVIKENLPPGFQECISYGMIGYVVPLSRYPKGYHCNPELPLPFLALASQKNFVALYPMGLYADRELHNWFVGEYPIHMKTKLDMGKSCIRFKNPEAIPYALIGELCRKMDPDQWIERYEGALRKS